MRDRLAAISINPEMATINDIAHMSADLLEAQELLYLVIEYTKGENVTWANGVNGSHLIETIKRFIENNATLDT